MSSAREFHDLAEAQILNGESALQPGGEAVTAWGNLGLWAQANTYPEACRDLALRVGEAAGLSTNSRVFDVGFGCGDQLLLWNDAFGVAELSGINLSRSQTALARWRLQRAGRNEAGLLCGSVNDPRLWPEPGTKDALLALDCAYHFPSRKEFFASAHRATRQGGRLVLADIVRGGARVPAVDQAILHTVARASHIPSANLVTSGEYERQLTEVGWSVRQAIDLTDDVFLPFGDWLRQYRVSKWAPALRPWAWSKYRVTARMLAWAARTQALRFVLVVAEKT